MTDSKRNVDFYNSQSSAAWLASLPVFPGEENMLGRMNEKAKGVVVDIGCGSGRLYPALVATGHEYRGIDVAERQVAVFKSRFPEANVVVGDGVCLPWPDSSSNYAVLAYHVIEAIHPFHRRLESLLEVRRILRDGGRCFLSHHVRRNYRFRQQVLHYLRHWHARQEFGDLCVSGPTAAGRMYLDNYFMHIPSARELDRLASRASFRRGIAWDFDYPRGTLMGASAIMEEWIAL